MINETLITNLEFKGEMITSIAWKGNYGVIGTLNENNYGTLFLIKLEDQGK